MLLNDEAGCAGQYIRIQARTAAICYGCKRYGHNGPIQIAPAAAMRGPGLEWECVNRRSLGHVETLPAEAPGSNPLTAPHPQGDGCVQPQESKQ
jgi:hypothetical protein